MQDFHIRSDVGLQAAQAEVLLGARLQHAGIVRTLAHSAGLLDAGDPSHAAATAAAGLMSGGFSMTRCDLVEQRYKPRCRLKCRCRCRCTWASIGLMSGSSP